MMREGRGEGWWSGFVITFINWAKNENPFSFSSTDCLQYIQLSFPRLLYPQYDLAGDFLLFPIVNSTICFFSLYFSLPVFFLPFLLLAYQTKWWVSVTTIFSCMFTPCSYLYLSSYSIIFSCLPLVPFFLFSTSLLSIHKCAHTHTHTRNKRGKKRKMQKRG